VFKIVFLDGNLSSGNARSLKGTIKDEDELYIYLERPEGDIVRINHHFIIKIEEVSG